MGFERIFVSRRSLLTVSEMTLLRFPRSARQKLILSYPFFYHSPSREIETSMKLKIDINGTITYELSGNELDCEKKEDEAGEVAWKCVAKPGCT